MKNYYHYAYFIEISMTWKQWNLTLHHLYKIILSLRDSKYLHSKSVRYILHQKLDYKSIKRRVIILQINKQIHIKTGCTTEYT